MTRSINCMYYHCPVVEQSSIGIYGWRGFWIMIFYLVSNSGFSQCLLHQFFVSKCVFHCTKSLTVSAIWIRLNRHFLKSFSLKSQWSFKGLRQTVRWCSIFFYRQNFFDNMVVQAQMLSKSTTAVLHNYIKTNYSRWAFRLWKSTGARWGDISAKTRTI